MMFHPELLAATMFSLFDSAASIPEFSTPSAHLGHCGTHETTLTHVDDPRP